MERRTLLKGLAAMAGAGFLARSFGLLPAGAANAGETFEVVRSEEEWRKILTEEQYKVLREEWTEPPFKNTYHDHHEKGTYFCAGCDLPLFSSQHKYESHTGWPSFWQPKFSDSVATKTDWKLLYPRTEVHCARCGGHLGHIFDDGPPPTYKRYCINSAALVFQPSQKAS